MIFHGAFTSVLKLLTHEAFKALFIDSNSLTPINAWLLILVVVVFIVQKYLKKQR